MRKYLLILFIFLTGSVNSQVVADTTIYVTIEDDTIKVVSFRNLATTPFIPKIDTAALVASQHRVDSIAAALAASVAATYGTITNLNLKAPINNATFTGTFAVAAGAIGNAALANGAVANLSGTNTGDNATNTQYSGLAASKENTFTVLSGKSLATFNYAADAGANDTYVISLSPSPGSYTTGMIVIFRANTVNTGAASLNVNSLGAITIVKRVSTTLANADIASQQFCMVVYNGTNFVLMNPTVN